MVEALTRDPSLLTVALRIVYTRMSGSLSCPQVLEVFEQIQGMDIPVCVSGAGPSLLAFEQDGRVIPDLGDGWSVLRPGIRSKGFEVSVER